MLRSRVFFTVALICVLTMPMATTSQAQATTRIKLTPYEGNPILVQDKTLIWEAGGIGRQRVVFHAGQFHMLYQGYSSGQFAGAVNYATSQDGLHWTRYEKNPVFVPDKKIAPGGVLNLAVFLKEETWFLYFAPWRSGKAWYQFGSDLLIATAPSPTGPWALAADPALTESKVQDWDFSVRYVPTVTRGKEGYVMYFHGGGSGKTGFATSPDGIHWTLYNDPMTTSSPYTSGDPVFGRTDLGVWDSGYMESPIVRLTDKGWEMFYAGGKNRTEGGIGYATSPDGITWTRFGDGPVLLEQGKVFFPESVVEADGKHYLYYVILNSSYEPQGIAVAEITYG